MKFNQATKGAEMTDQTEPKYKIGQNVLLTNGSTMKIESMQYVLWSNPYITCEADYEYEWEYHGSGQLSAERYILYPVAIHPIEHHKCKDCEHWALENDQPKITCPTSHWMDKHFYSEISNTEDMEPSPNCYCFTPKLSPDEKESNGKDM